MAKFILHSTTSPFPIETVADIGNADPSTVPAPPAGYARVWDAGNGGDLTEAEFQLAGVGERPRWNAAQPAGSRVSENPYPRVRFTPDNFDVNVGDAQPNVTIRSEDRDGNLIPFNGTYLLYIRENGLPLPVRVTLVNGEVTMPISTATRRFVEVGNQENAQGQLRAIAVSTLRITVAGPTI